MSKCHAGITFLSLIALNIRCSFSSLVHWTYEINMAVCQNLVPLVNIKIAGKWMFIPLKMVLIGIDPYPYGLKSPKAKREPGSLQNLGHIFLGHFVLLQDCHLFSLHSAPVFVLLGCPFLTCPAEKRQSLCDCAMGEKSPCFTQKRKCKKKQHASTNSTNVCKTRELGTERERERGVQTD